MTSIRPMTLKDYWAQAIPSRYSSTDSSAQISSTKSSDYQKRFEPKQIADQTPRPAATVSPSSAGAGWIQDLIKEKSQKYNVPEELVQSIVQAESAFNPHAVSPAGAQGLMQLMPGTAKDLGVNNPFDPAQNLEGGVRYFRQMLDRFQDIPKALAAYNAGPGNVAKYQGIPPYRETQNYVRKILKNYQNA